MGVSLVLLLHAWAHECMGFILAVVDCWEAAVTAITLPMRRAVAKTNNARILYDADAAAYALNDWFEPETLDRFGWLSGSASGGRGAVYFFSHAGKQYALRHYRRGGKAAALLGDRYLWTGLENSRAWREWMLLAKLAELRLPAPRPFAARVIRCGVFYRADLITERIANASSLFARLTSGRLPDILWREIGRVIANFHALGVWHADLNAHNVLLSRDDAVSLVDFDRARIQRNSAGAREANLARLLRSLRKLKRLHPDLGFRDSDFELVLDGYGSAVPTVQSEILDGSVSVRGIPQRARSSVR
jgi:3-deoxy-D-manno-octulosonic acid kinase